MKKILFIMILLGFFLDYSFLSVLAPGHAGANVLLIMITISCLERNFMEAVGWSLLAGSMLDYVSHTPFGTNIFLFILLVWIFDFLRRKLLPENISMFIAFVVFSSSFIFYEAMKFIFLRLLNILSIYPLPINFIREELLVFLAVKVFIVFLGLLFYGIYLKAKGVWGIDKLEIKV